jgi:branched-chain amino acid transport system permease protein
MLVALAVLPNFLKSYGVYLMTLFCVYLMATMGLNLTVGYAGQMSLGHAAFLGIGAYHAAILMKLGWPFLAVLPVAAVVCFAVGLALGFPALRVQHHYLAFATLGFNILVYLVMRNEEKVTGGTFGISGIPRPSLFGFSLDGSLAFFYFTFGSVLLLGLVLWWLLRSPWGRAFAALRDNPIRAESLGINITAYTLLAFAIGAACAGIGGVYFAALVQFIEPSPFNVCRVAHDAPCDHRRRFRALLRSCPRHGRRRAAAGMAALHAELVSRRIRLCRRGVDGLASRRTPVDPRTLRKAREKMTAPRNFSK